MAIAFKTARSYPSTYCSHTGTIAFDSYRAFWLLTWVCRIASRRIASHRNHTDWLTGWLRWLAYVRPLSDIDRIRGIAVELHYGVRVPAAARRLRTIMGLPRCCHRYSYVRFFCLTAPHHATTRRAPAGCAFSLSHRHLSLLPLVEWYSLLDNLDGRQARRTQTSSPLGELFDHGIVSSSTVSPSILHLCKCQYHTVSNGTTRAEKQCRTTRYFCVSDISLSLDLFGVLGFIVVRLVPFATQKDAIAWQFRYVAAVVRDRGSVISARERAIRHSNRRRLQLTGCSRCFRLER